MESKAHTITDWSGRISKYIVSPPVRRVHKPLFRLLGSRVLSSVKALDP